uniref:Reverse transcriptase/retrotransposon-derived protein RNase H-like domain-containing protein n=1 Tax=Cannabis sativa TaxID=3483 RepID=A0A803P9X6_CANSA
MRLQLGTTHLQPGTTRLQLGIALLQYMETHLDEERLVAPEKDMLPSVVGSREANINRAQVDEEHQHRVPSKVPKAVEDIRTVIGGSCVGGKLVEERQITTRPQEPTTVITHGGPCQNDKKISELDPRVYEEVRVESVEELEEIVISESPPKVLKIRKGLLETLKKELKEFLESNLDVFSWGHEDMEGMDPTNAGATYQGLVNKMFANQIGCNMEVYVDEMLIKTKKAKALIQDLGKMFATLRKYQMKLNPLKCVFGVSSKKFLGFMVNERGIEANPEKIKALVDMESPKNRKEAFASLKEHLGNPPLLAKLEKGEKLYVYLTISEHALSVDLVRGEGKKQQPMYYISKRFVDTETRYPEIKKLAYALIVASRRLKPYFHAHAIVVLTNHPLRQVQHKPKTSRHFLKWSIDLSQFNISYTPRVSINRQVMADFVAEFTYRPDGEDQGHEVGEESKSEAKEEFIWELHVDGASKDSGAGAGVIMTTLGGI